MEDSEQNKSEQATPFKLTKAREKGSVARGTDLSFLTGLAAALAFAWTTGGSFAETVMHGARQTLASASGSSGDPASLGMLIAQAAGGMVAPIGMLIATIFIVVLFFEVLQTGLIFSAAPLKPDFSRLNPANNLKRLVSMRVLLETAKNVVKLTAYATIAYLVISNAYASLVPAVWDGSRLGVAMAQAGGRLLAGFMLAALVFALIDQLIVRRDFGKKMRMSRREVRRESRDREGDPRIKQRRKQLHREFTKSSQSMRNVRGADVLVTNPSHFAVALRYDSAVMDAPRVVSLGANQLALRLKSLAFFYGVTIVEDPPLARALFRSSHLDQEVPAPLYQPVADVYLRLRRTRTGAPAGERDV